MRLPLVLSVSVFLAGCVPTADFRDLRDEVRQLQAENRKLKERLESQDQVAKPTDVAKKLEALDSKVESVRIKQQGVDQKLGELLRQAEEPVRRQDPVGAREEAGAKSAVPPMAKEFPKSEVSVAPPPQAGGPEPLALLAPTALYNQAYNDYLKGNYDLAIAGFGDLLKRFPGVSQSAHAQYWIGRSHYNKKDYRQAIDTYERVLAEYPKNDKVPAVLFEAGLAYAELGEAPKARDRKSVV